MTSLVRSALAGLLFASAVISAHAATLRGTVSVATGPLSGAVVSAYDVSGVLQGNASTDAAGHYVLLLTAGSYRLVAYDPAGVYATVFYENAESFDTSVFVPVAEGSPLDISFTLPRAGVLTGFVQGGEAPLKTGVVEVYNLSGTRRAATTTNASGAYSIVLPAGDYKVFAYDANDFFAGVFAPSANAFAEAAPIRIDPPAVTTVTFRLRLAARVRGVVLDAGTQAPLAQQLVYVYTPEGALVASTVTDSAGAFRFSLAAGSYRFVAADPSGSYAPVFFATSRSFEGSDIVTVTPGEIRDLTMAAERGAVIRGQVHAPVTMTIVAYNLDGTRHASTLTNEGGVFALVVAPGTYRLAAIDFSGQYAPQFYRSANFFDNADEIAVVAGQSLAAIDFTPIRAGQLTGTVRDGANQQLLSGMTVAAYDLTGVLNAQTQTGFSGEYRLVLAPGQYLLLAFDSRLDYATAYAGGATAYERTSPLTVEAGVEKTATFLMFRGIRVTGTVVEEHGETLDGVEVFALDAAGARVAGARTTSGGAFTIVLQSGMYILVTRDPYQRYAMRTGGTPIAVGPTPPAPVTLTMETIKRRRAVRT